LSKLFLKNVLV